MKPVLNHFDYGVPVPLRPALRSNAWTREPRLRSELIFERISFSTGAGWGALRSCTLRASSAETAIGPKGTNPLNAAFSELPERCSCRRSIRRFGGRRWIRGSSFGCGDGEVTGSPLWERLAPGAACDDRLLPLRQGDSFLRLPPRSLFGGRSGENISRALQEAYFSINLSYDFCPCHFDLFYPTKGT